jgi:hypothetical protein
LDEYLSRDAVLKTGIPNAKIPFIQNTKWNACGRDDILLHFLVKKPYAINSPKASRRQGLTPRSRFLTAVGGSLFLHEAFIA